MRLSVRFMGILFAGALLLPSGQATAASFYSYVEMLAFPSGADEAEGSGASTAEAGDYCFFYWGSPSCGGGLPAWGRYSVNAWGEISADPATGEIAALQDVHNYGAPTGGFYTRYGETLGFAYLRSTWQVVSDDPSLEAGDIVDLQLSFDLDGSFSIGDRGAATGYVAFMVNDLTASTLGDPYLGISGWETVQGALGDQMILSESTNFWHATWTGNLQDSFSFQATVGEVLALETAFLLNLWIDRVGGDTDTFSNADFAHTLSSALEATTPGIRLEAVPEPGSAILLAMGISGLACLGRRRGGSRL